MGIKITREMTAKEKTEELIERLRLLEYHDSAAHIQAMSARIATLKAERDATRMYEPYPDDELLKTLDAFGPRHMVIHEAAWRIRRLIAEKATVQGETLADAIVKVQSCIEPYSKNDSTDEELVASGNASLQYAITKLESLRTAKPEPLCSLCKVALVIKYLECPSCARVCTPEQWQEMQNEADRQYDEAEAEADANSL